MQTTIKWYDPIDHVIVQMCQTIQIHYIYIKPNMAKLQNNHLYEIEGFKHI